MASQLPETVEPLKTLADWLAWQERLHPTDIELGLERVSEVARRLDLLDWGIPIISVAGSNGKGSCVAYLNNVYSAAGYRVGVFTSPHLWRYQERVVYQQRQASESELITAFTQIEHARKDISLTYFEFGTLAALFIFKQHKLDVLVLEVGLGGRLDAVNIVDADVALIAPISFDHQDWLGGTLDEIATEKAGIMRSGRTAVSVDVSPPAALQYCANKLEIDLIMPEHGYAYRRGEGSWSWCDSTTEYTDLPEPGLAGEFQYANAAGVIAVVQDLQNQLSVPYSAIQEGLRRTRIPGRFSRLSRSVEIIIDVAHNPAAALALAQNLAATPCAGKSLAVFGILADKDINTVLQNMRGCFDAWYLADLPDRRGSKASDLALMLEQQDCPATPEQVFATVADAWLAAKSTAIAGDRIVVFGSFLTVEALLAFDAEIRAALGFEV